MPKHPNRLDLERLHAVGKEHAEAIGAHDEIHSLVSAFNGDLRLVLLCDLYSIPPEKKTTAHEILRAKLRSIEPAYVQLVMEGWFVELPPGEEPTRRPSEDPRRGERIMVVTGSKLLDTVIQTDYTITPARGPAGNLTGGRVLTATTDKHTSWLSSTTEGGLWNALFER